MIKHKELIDGFNAVKNSRTHFQNISPKLSERAVFIINQLTRMGFPFSVELFSVKEIYFYNIIVNLIGNKSTDTIMLTAHHDVLNINSDNVNDNTASIVNLLVLMQKIWENPEGINTNIIVAFPDCEEYGGVGAQILSQDIKKGKYGNVKYILNLELTAHGKNIWIERLTYPHMRDGSVLLKNLKEFLGKENYEEEFIPFADSVIFQKHEFDSLTIGTLPLNEDKRYDYSVWFICHRDNDDLYNIEDMESFTNFLFNFIKSEQ